MIIIRSAPDVSEPLMTWFRNVAGEFKPDALLRTQTVNITLFKLILAAYLRAFIDKISGQFTFFNPGFLIVYNNDEKRVVD